MYLVACLYFQRMHHVVIGSNLFHSRLTMDSVFSVLRAPVDVWTEYLVVGHSVASDFNQVDPCHCIVSLDDCEGFIPLVVKSTGFSFVFMIPKFNKRVFMDLEKTIVGSNPERSLSLSTREFLLGGLIG